MSKKEDDLGKIRIKMSEAQTGVSTTSFLTAVTIFFTGILINNFEKFESSIKIPILFLIIATFSFLYSSLIFANSAGQLSRLNPNKFEKHMLFGDSLSEYLGVYLLVLAIPLVINVVTPDTFLRFSVLISAISGLTIYHAYGFSIMERNFEKSHYIYLTIIILFEILLFYLQIKGSLIFQYIALLLLGFILFLTFYSRSEN